MDQGTAGGPDADEEERALLARSALGDQDALHALFTRYRPRLWPYLWHQLGGDVTLAEEVLQDVFIAAWQYAATFRGEGRVAAWLYRLAHHRAANALRDRSRRAEGHIIALPEQEIAAFSRSSPENTIIDRMVLTEAMRQLSDPHRTILILIFVHGFSQAEVAAIVGIPLGTIKSRLAQARQQLHAAFTNLEATDHV